MENLTPEQVLFHITEILKIRDEKDNERDKRYSERFDSQDRGVNIAMTAAEKAVNAALISADNAVKKAEAAAEKRFEGVNEFRATLSDQAQTFITRTEVAAKLDNHTEKLGILGTRLQTIEAHSGGLKDGWGYLVGAVGVVAGIFGVLAIIYTFSR